MSSPAHIADEVRIQPRRRNPFYIVSPSYTHQSAGIKALHLFCHSLNRRGQLAFLVKQDIFEVSPFEEMDLNPDLLTPPLTLKSYELHRDAGLTPIVVYPETITGNPLAASVVVRYVLNFPGLLGGDRAYADDEMVFAYSSKLAEAAGIGEDRVLFLPASDTDIFYPPNTDQLREGACFYADKYRKVHGAEPFDITKDAVEITRGIGSQSTEEVAELFRRSELFYCYENSALAFEAALCGCPTVYLPNEHLTEIIALQELGMDGFAWGNVPEEIERAKSTVHRAFENYSGNYVRFWQQLDRFIDLTTKLAAVMPPSALAGMSKYSDLVTLHQTPEKPLEPVAAEPVTILEQDLPVDPLPSTTAECVASIPLAALPDASTDRGFFTLRRAGLLARKHRRSLAAVCLVLLVLAGWLV